MSSVGDLHNFGEFVYAEDNQVFKPRTLFWENLFLNSKSELRQLVDSLCINSNITSPFSVAPDLEFSTDYLKNGWVERLVLVQPVGKITFEEVQGVAAMVGLCYWFGIGDLHHENVFAGRNQSSTLICFPVDIEVVFDKMTHVNQTLLLPSERVPEDKCGLFKILESLRSLSEDSRIMFVETFLKFINILNENVEVIMGKVLELNSSDSNLVRVILRDTKTYRGIIEGRILCEDLIEEEKVQLSRGEIPFFVRNMGSDTIYYFRNKEKELEMVKSIITSISLSNISLTHSLQIDCLKTHTAIYSAAYIAEHLGLEVEYGLSTSLIRTARRTIKCSFNETIKIYEMV